MDTALSLLSLVLPATVALASVLLVSINVYLKLRRRFPVRVNCWFCNENAQIEYEARDGFDCPSCLQYNGFNEDGDYNKPIPAQYDEMLNRHLPALERIDGYNTTGVTNGLCHLCNNNQRLKVYQLANFIPLNEANYDEEIEHFQKQLEKSYRLCPHCDKVVRTTLQRQMCTLGLKLTKLRRKGAQLLNLRVLSKRNRSCTLINVALITCALLNVCNTFKKIDLYIYKNLLDGISTYVDGYEWPMFDELCFAWRQLSVLFNGWKWPESSTIVCWVSACLQTASLALDFRRDTRKRLLCLFLSGVLIWSKQTRPYQEEWPDMYVGAFQVVTSAMIIIATVAPGTTKTEPIKLKSIKRVARKQTARLQQVSDCEEDDDCNTPPLKKADSFHRNDVYHSSPVGFDINASLNGLNLGAADPRRPPSIVPAFTVNRNLSRPRPVISPSKLRNVTQNSWVAGGFWRDPNGILFPFSPNPCGLSRSSSQTSSGFVSLDAHHSLPSSMNDSFCGDSMASEPQQHQHQDRRMAYHNGDFRHIFYPAMNHEQLVYVAPLGFSSGFRVVHDSSMRSNWYDKDF